jgi:hypothetical protein
LGPAFEGYFFPIFLVLCKVRRRGWQIMCSSLMEIFNGIYHLPLAQD